MASVVASIVLVGSVAGMSPVDATIDADVSPVDAAIDADMSPVDSSTDVDTLLSDSAIVTLRQRRFI